jgi:hypothetical protein
LGHQRFTPPFTEDAGVCADCIDHKRNGALDTLVVTFRNDADLKRLHTLVLDHTVLTFLTDSFDHIKGNPTINAKMFVDTVKVRNQVEFWSTPDHRHHGHLELVSEIQMSTKDYAGIYTRHLHLEPIAPACKKGIVYSDLWIDKSTLDVISTSTFGGFGTVHADVYVERAAHLAPGYASLGFRGNCYEQMAGTLKMKDLYMDKGAELFYSVGNQPGLYDELADCIEVDNLFIAGSVDIYVEKRCEQVYVPGCYPIILYKTVEDFHLNNLNLATKTIDGYPLALSFDTPGIVYLCVGDSHTPRVQREVVLPTPPAGVFMFPPAGVHYVPWGSSFTFTLTFSGGTVYEVSTSRNYDGTALEVLTGVPNANGEYVYTLPFVKTQPIYVYIGPRIVDIPNVTGDQAAVWSSGNTLYIKVSAEDIASIYAITGQLVKRVDVPEGGTTLPLSRGSYIVTLKDGSVHKVIIR